MKHEFNFSLVYDQIPGAELKTEWTQEKENQFLFTASAHLENDIPVGDWQVRIQPAFTPTFTYTPHLTPDNRYVIDMHVFRTPVVMMGTDDCVLCVLPVIDHEKGEKNRYYMDLNVPKNLITLGITTTRIGEHVLYFRTDEAILPAGDFIFQCRVMILTKKADIANPYRPILAWYWENYGHEQSKRLPAAKDLHPYVKHTYDWAFDRWKDVVWQEFEMNGVKVGAPQFIVITRQSPNYPGVHFQREFLSIWNQAWFCSLRSAQGVYRYGKMTGNEDYVQKALLTKELALQFPQYGGLFDTVVGAPNETFTVDGVSYQRSMGWDHMFFGNSNRNPRTWDPAQSPRHVLDMSWTALHMLTWYEELEKDERLVAYVTSYAERLLRLQDAKGYFPAWIDQRTGEILEELSDSPECAVTVTLLLKLYEMTGDKRYQESALKCMDVLIREVMPESRWEDFETYWSCSRYGAQTMLGRKFKRNNCYKQCSLSPFWMAQALLAAYRLTKDEGYLQAGEKCLDEMLMYQSSFQPNYMAVTAVGGFGVMNCDAELNDARQSMFAELIVEYGKVFNRPEYIERGMAALRASFSMMYCPENPIAKEQWEKRWPFLNEKDYGFMMENYGHDGYTNGANLGIGEFTIYDWGNGAASEAVMRMKAHHPELF